MIVFTFVYLLLFIRFSEELNNGLGRTPQMGNRSKFFIGRVDLILIFLLTKDGIVGTISLVALMKLLFDKQQMPL